MNSFTAYVAGFMFDHSRTRVALIRKKKPVWQAGKLNGIGGKIEDGESPGMAMVREFAEEAGYETTEPQWLRFAQMGDGKTWSVDFFAATGALDLLETIEAEQIEIVGLGTISPLRTDMIENLPWLIPLALDSLHDGRPGFTQINYPPIAPEPVRK